MTTQLTPAQALAQLRAKQTPEQTPSAPSTGGSVADALAKLRAQAASAPLPPPKLGDGAAGEFAGNALRAVTSPLVRLGGVIESGLDQTLGRAINKSKGNGAVPTTSGQEAQAAANRIDAGAETTTAGKIGTGVGVVAPYLTGAGEEEGAVLGAKVASKGLGKAAGYVASKIPELAANTAIGTAQSGDLKEGATTGAEFTALGVGGDIVKGAVKGIKSVLSPTKAIDRLEQTYTDLSSSTKSGKKAVVKAGATTKAKNAAGTVGNTPQRTLAEAGIVPRVNGTKLDTAEQAIEFRNSTAPLRTANRDALKEVEQATQPLKTSDLESEALARANSKANIDSGEAGPLAKEIQSQFAELRAHYGENLPITLVDDIKSARWGKVKFDLARPNLGGANYIIAKTAQQAIEDTANSAGFTHVAQLNRVIGDHLEGAKFLESLDGKTLANGRLGKFVFQGIGASLGKTIPGKILGALGGDAVARVMMDMSVAGPVKRTILRGIEKKDPEAYKLASQWLEEQGLLRDTRLALPAGKAGTNPIPMGGRNLVNQPVDATGRVVSPEQTPAQVIQGEHAAPEQAPLLQLPAGNPEASTINQGRPIISLPRNSEYVGPDTVVQRPQSFLPSQSATSMANSVEASPTITPSMPRGFANTKVIQTIGGLAVPAAISADALVKKANEPITPVPDISDPLFDQNNNIIPPKTGETPASTAPGTYTDPVRKLSFSENDLNTLRNVLYAEISNRNQDKRQLETRTIINTVLNRMLAHGSSMDDVLTAKNQYQGYDSKQFKIATSGKGNKEKLAAIDDVIAQLKGGKLPDTTNGAAYYIHNKDGSITYDDTRKY